MAQTSEEKKASIGALLEERKGYERRAAAAEESDDEEKLKAAKERLAGVDKELKRLGGSAEKPSQRAQQRPAQRESSQR